MLKTIFVTFSKIYNFIFCRYYPFPYEKYINNKGNTNIMSNTIKYKILMFDDDPVYLNALEEAIYSIVGNSKNYDIYLEKTTSSRRALVLAEDFLFDVFILDICSRKYDKYSLLDDFDYQGQDLYNNLLDNHPKLVYHAKFIVISNLPQKTAKKIFKYKEAEYLYKQQTNCYNLAYYLKSYFDEKFKRESNENKDFLKNKCYNLNVNGDDNYINLQINISKNNSNLNVFRNDTISKLEALIRDIYSSANFLSKNDLITLNKNIELLKEELSKKEPKKNIIKKIIDALSAIKNTAEFGAAVAALIEFISKFNG